MKDLVQLHNFKIFTSPQLNLPISFSGVLHLNFILDQSKLKHQIELIDRYKDPNRRQFIKKSVFILLWAAIGIFALNRFESFMKCINFK